MALFGLFGSDQDTGQTSDPDVLLGDLLLSEKIITPDQLEKAMQFQQAKNEGDGPSLSLAKAVVDLGFMPAGEMVKTVNQNFRIQARTIDDDINRLIIERQLSFAERLLNMRIPIRYKLAMSLTIFLIIFTMILSYFMLKRQSDNLYKESVKTGKVSLHYFSTEARIPLLNDDTLRLNSLIKEATAVEGVVYAVIVGRDNIVKAHSNLGWVGKEFEQAGESGPKTDEGNTYYYDRILPSGEQILNLASPITFQNKELGTVHVGISLNFIADRINAEKRFIYIIAFLFFVAGMAVTTLLGLNFSRPISKLVVATREISNGNFHHKVNFKRKDEFGDLANAFNFMSHELWLKSIMRESFGRYVSTAIRDLILADPENVWLKGVKNDVTIVFADVRGFTKYSESNDPAVIVEQLNEFFDVAAKNIEQYGGYIDKFIGDEVLAVFGGLPDSGPDHPEQAVQAVWAMQRELTSKQGKNPLMARVGASINTGTVVSGNIGSEVRMEYTVIGDSVNVASRLNGLAEAGRIVISESTYEKVKGFVEVSELQPQMVKGKAEPLQPFVIDRVLEDGGTPRPPVRWTGGGVAAPPPPKAGPAAAAPAGKTRAATPEEIAKAKAARQAQQAPAQQPKPAPAQQPKPAPAQQQQAPAQQPKPAAAPQQKPSGAQPAPPQAAPKPPQK